MGGEAGEGKAYRGGAFRRKAAKQELLWIGRVPQQKTTVKIAVQLAEDRHNPRKRQESPILVPQRRGYDRSNARDLPGQFKRKSNTGLKRRKAYVYHFDRRFLG